MNFRERMLVVMNPAAGRGRAGRFRPAVEAYFHSQGVCAEFCAPISGEAVRERASAAAANGFSCVVAMGGDGTFHQIVNGLIGTGAMSGLLPAGGGNDIARALALPRDPIEAARALLHSRPRSVDVLQVRTAGGRTSLYVGAGGVGIDAEGARLANTRFRALPGVARYLAAGISAFRDSRPLRVELEADGIRETAVALLVAVANAPSYGSGIIIAPDALLDDGWMDIAVVAPLAWAQVFDGMLLALRDGNIRWPEMRRRKARRLRLSTDRPAIFHGDGEVLGETPVEIEVLPGALTVLTPP
jgi:YegS/Rv2252/BmrU family lipid kinase